MVEQGTRVDRLVSIDVAERFEALQDEVDLLKNEIKQTLVDMREHMMKNRTVFAQPEVDSPRRAPSPLPPRLVHTKEPPAAKDIVPASGNKAPMGRFGPGSQTNGMDPAMLGNVISWLGTVKQMGISLQQVTPFLEAYEDSGYLPPIMLKVLLRSLADLDQMTETPPENEFSPERYSECIGQLHDIVCAVIDVEEQPLSNHELPERYSQEDPGTSPEGSVESEHGDDGQASDQAGSPGSNGSADPDVSNYKLTTIKVPEAGDFGGDSGGAVDG